MFYRFPMTCLIVFGLIMFTACGRSPEMTTPDMTPNDHTANTTHHACWGVWDVAINAATGEVETIPLRTADFNANVVRFLQPPVAPIHLINIEVNKGESDILNGLLDMDITLRHPFPGATKFRGFDVHGIILAEGGNKGIYDPSVTYAAPGQTMMLNPDGFTRWWNQVEFTTYGTILGYTEGNYANPGFTSTSTLNPYKLHTESLEPAQPIYQMDLSTRATFRAIDGAFRRTYRLQFDATAQPIYGFKYSIDACWSKPDPAFDPEYPVEAFDENANCQEPYLVKIKEYEEIPYYVDEYVSGGDLIFLLTIGDWQATGGSVLDEISHVWLESPTLFGVPIDVRDSMEFVESTHDTQATYRVGPLENLMPDGLDGQQLLITVESADPDTFEPQIEGDTSWVDYPDAPLAAYGIFDVPVTNLTPQGEYAYCSFIPDWCATMRTQCANDADNQMLLTNIMTQNIEGYYNDYTHVKIYEGRSHTSGQNISAFSSTCSTLGYTVDRDYSVPWTCDGCRVVITVLWRIDAQPLDPPFTTDECDAMLEFIENGGILFFMCEASIYFNNEGLTDFFDYLGMLMEYGGGATPEMSDGYTENITWHWLTENVELYHYYTCGEWITMDPFVLTLIATEYDEKAVLMYPLPLE